jgi:hypothetical protein
VTLVTLGGGVPLSSTPNKMIRSDLVTWNIRRFRKGLALDHMTKTLLGRTSSQQDSIDVIPIIFQEEEGIFHHPKLVYLLEANSLIGWPTTHSGNRTAR